MVSKTHGIENDNFDIIYLLLLQLIGGMNIGFLSHQNSTAEDAKNEAPPLHVTTIRISRKLSLPW